MSTASIAEKRVQAQPDPTVAGSAATASTPRSLYPSDCAFAAPVVGGGHRAITYSNIV